MIYVIPVSVDFCLIHNAFSSLPKLSPLWDIILIVYFVTKSVVLRVCVVVNVPVPVASTVPASFSNCTVWSGLSAVITITGLFPLATSLKYLSFNVSYCCSSLFTTTLEIFKFACLYTVIVYSLSVPSSATIFNVIDGEPAVS